MAHGTSETIAATLNSLQKSLSAVVERASVAEALSGVAQALSENLEANHVTLWIPHPTIGVLRPAFSNCPDELRSMLPMNLPIDSSRSGEAFLTALPKFYATLDELPPSCQTDHFRRLGLTPMWIVPILAPNLGIDRQVIAVASIHFKNDQDLSHLTLDVIEVLARTAGKAIEISLWREQDLLVRKTAEAVAEFGEGKGQPFNRLAEVVAESLHFEACTILMADEEHRLLQIVGTTGVEVKGSQVFGKMTYSYDERATGKIAVDRQVLAIDDLNKDYPVSQSRFPEITQTKNLRQFLGAPIALPDGRLVGVVRLRNKKAPPNADWPRALNALDLARIQRVATIIASLLSLVIKEAQQDAMIERMKHDLEMPAGAIRDFANYYSRLPMDRLRRSVEDDELRVKLQDTESFAEIIFFNSDLLHLSRSQQIPFEPKLTNIGTKSVVKLCKMLTPVAEKKGMGKVTYLGGEWLRDIPALYIDPRLFDIALYNLIHNAIKYSHRGNDIEVEGEMVTVDDAKYYEISVRNWGIGVSDAAAKELFKKYYRAPEALQRTANGVGIGLHTAQTLIELHGGKIVLLRKNMPTVFAIRLPAWLASRPPLPPLVRTPS